MTDLTETSWQYMHQKTGDELLWRKQHGFLFVVVGSIQISEGDPLHIPWQFHNSVSQIWDKWNMRF